MSRARRGLLLVGLASGLVGVLLVASPGVARGVSLTGAARTAPVAVVGVAAAALAARSLLNALSGDAASDSGGKAATADAFPSPERRPQYDPSGAEFARRVNAIEWTDRRDAEPANRRELRDDLRGAATSVLSRGDGPSPSEVETRLRDGSWTDDPLASAFFAGDLVPSLSPSGYARALVRGEPPFARRARRAAAALSKRSGAGDVTPAPSADVRAAFGDEPAVRTSRYLPDGEESLERESATDRVHGVTAAALAVGGLGIVTLRPGLLLLALFGITVSGYARAVPTPSQAVAVERAVSDAEPAVGDEVEVTLSVRNVGDATLADLRLVDGVPPGLAVVDGSPKFATALRPGKRASVTYTVEAVRGDHAFDPALVVTRDALGVRKRETLVDTETTVSCRPPAKPLSGRAPARTTTRAGRSRSDAPGPGVEFHSVREYRPGDPPSRIDWRRKAKTGEFSTVAFHEHRRQRVLVVVDARTEAYVAWGGGGDGDGDGDGNGEPVVQQGVAAADALASRFRSAGVPVGLAALSPRSCRLPPGRGGDHHRRLREALVANPAFGWEPPDGEVDASAAVHEIHRRVRADTRVVFVSPLSDDASVTAARRFDAHGHPVSVLSPDPTARTHARGYESGYASLARERRLRRLRAAGIPASDWDPTEPLREVTRGGQSRATTSR
ncbi:hypothetical protein ABY42_17540 (plasmid) [Haloferax gibbonsii]|uniref:DUF58 domain-containing protein n=1 Tax=Haloferax gibbonsii TaxID=35746 RepID=A0A0K1IZ61_HALGI|nr:hypothetical protein ABY42_17540 [Haloferax gibbonsii]